MQTMIQSALGYTFIAVALLMALAAWMIGRAIAKPVSLMTRTMTALAEGDDNVSIPGLKFRNEIGKMAFALQVFKDNAIENRRMSAERQRLEQEAQAERLLLMEDLARDLERSVGATVDAVCHSADALQEQAQASPRLWRAHPSARSLSPMLRKRQPSTFRPSPMPHMNCPSPFLKSAQGPASRNLWPRRP